MEEVEKTLKEYIEEKYIKYLKEEYKEKYKEHIKDSIEIEKKVEKIKNKICSTTQLRLLLSNSIVVKNKVSSAKLKKNDKLTTELLNEIKYLLIKHTYQCGRKPEVKEFDTKFKILDELKKIKTKNDFNEFYRYLEEIMAYVKYYIE